MIAALVRHTRILVPASVLVVAAVTLEWTLTTEDAPATASEGSLIRKPSTPKRPAFDRATTFTTIVERPLFAPNRRPAQQAPPKPAAPATTAPHAPPPVLAATLVGVFISPNGSSAIVRLANGKTTSVSEGGTIDGWVLKRVTPDLAQFNYGTLTVELAFPVHEASATGINVPATLRAPVRRRP